MKHDTIGCFLPKFEFVSTGTNGRFIERPTAHVNNHHKTDSAFINEKNQQRYKKRMCLRN